MPVAFVSATPFSSHRRPGLPARHRLPILSPTSTRVSQTTPRAALSLPTNPLSSLALALSLALSPAGPIRPSSLPAAPVAPSSLASSLPSHRPATRHTRLKSAFAVAPVRADTPVPKDASSELSSTSSSVSSDASKLSSAISLQDRISFYYGEFLMWNPGAKVLTLFAFTLAVTYLGSFVYRLADPEREETSLPFWHALRAIAAPFEDDWVKPSLRAASLAFATFGMIVFAILIGMVTDSVQSAVDGVDGDQSRVVLSNHMLVCGWGSHVAQMLKDVGSVTPDLKVVVLAPPGNKEQMIDEMRATMSDEQRSKMKILFRSGAPEFSQDLRRVGASRAGKIILVNDRAGDSVDGDRLILSHALSLRQNLPAYKGDVVAELHNSRDEGIVQSILSNSPARSVETVNTGQLLFRFMAQAIRQPGLADVVALLMGEDPNCVFHVGAAKKLAPQLVGVSYSDLRPTSIPGCIICGFVDDEGVVHLENGPKYGERKGGTVTATTKFVVLGVSKWNGNGSGSTKTSTYELSGSTAALLHGKEGTTSAVDKTDGAKNFLVLGWREDMESMLQELDTMVGSRSKVMVVDEDVPSRVQASLKNLDVSLVKKRADRYDTIEEAVTKGSKGWDHVVVLGSAIGTEVDDSKALATLIYVNDVVGKLEAKGESKTMVTVEFVNEGVAEMAREQGNVGNAMLPQHLSAKIAAQTVRDSRLNGVWQELLSQAGREVYLRPAGHYEGIGGERMSFGTVADSLAKAENEIVVGYIPRFGSQVKLNPQGGERFSTRVWSEQDILVVLSPQ